MHLICIMHKDTHHSSLSSGRGQFGINLCMNRWIPKATIPKLSRISRGEKVLCDSDITLYRRENDSGVKCSEHTPEFLVGTHLSRLALTKLIHRFFLRIASLVSSFRKGIRCNEIPFSAFAMFQQPKTTHLY
jgi:hypothetical protein